MANDLAAMKARIADELARSDLTSQIAGAIGDAIAAYQTERLFFNESRTLAAFDTAAAQQDYAAADNPHIPDLLAIDYVALTVGSMVSLLRRERPEVIEDLTNNQPAIGEPYAFTYYDRLVRLYPVPGRIYPVRIAGHLAVAAPASDDEAGNPWMVEAERLIRSRAKYELATHVLRDAELAAAMTAAIGEALDQLKGRTARQTGTGRVVATQF